MQSSEIVIFSTNVYYLLRDRCWLGFPTSILHSDRFSLSPFSFHFPSSLLPKGQREKEGERKRERKRERNCLMSRNT